MISAVSASGRGKQSTVLRWRPERVERGLKTRGDGFED